MRFEISWKIIQRLQNMQTRYLHALTMIFQVIHTGYTSLCTIIVDRLEFFWLENLHADNVLPALPKLSLEAYCSIPRF